MSKPRALTAHAADGDARASRSPLRRIAAALVALALGAGLSLIGVAAPASAHTGDLEATAKCNTATGQYDVTYTLKLSNVPNGKTGTTKWRVGGTQFEGTPSNATNMDRGPISSKGNETIVLGTEQLAGTTKGSGPWIYAYTTWSGADKGSDGRVEGLAGNCGDGGGESPEKKIEYCHSGNGKKYEKIETSVNAFYQSGHIDHDDDIWPAFSFWKHGKLIEVAAQGDQSLLQYKDCEGPKVIPVDGAPTFLDPCGADNEKLTVPKDTSKIDWKSVESNGVITVTATAKPGYVFEQGAKTQWVYTINDGPCVVDVVGAPSFADECGPHNEVLQVPADTTTIDWKSVESNGVITVTATPKSGYAFPEGAKTHWEFELNDGPCVVDVVGAPSFSDTCGPDNEVLQVPADTTTIDWSSAEVDGVITVTATPKSGYAFPEGAKTQWTFAINDAPCVIQVDGAPTFVDPCGPGNDVLTVPADTTTIDWNSVEVDGVITVTATAKPGSIFPEGAQVSWTYTINDNPCVIDLVGAPTFADECGPDNEVLTVPADTDTIDWSSTEAAGVITVTATAKPGFTFAEGTTSSWQYVLMDQACIQPTLDGSLLTGICEADAPWITFDVVLTDPDSQATSTAVTLVLSDGVNTETLELGELDADGTLEDRVLWPGASVDDDGNANGWPGWAFEDGKWVETDGNFAWTRTLTSAVMHVNPDLTVALTYPEATPECAAGPPTGPDGEATPAGNGAGLASTGFAGTTIAIVAGIIVVAGIAFLVIARLRRKNA